MLLPALQKAPLKAPKCSLPHWVSKVEEKGAKPQLSVLMKPDNEAASNKSSGSMEIEQGGYNHLVLAILLDFAELFSEE